MAKLQKIGVDICMLPIDSLDGHPLNPRPRSSRFGMRVDDGNVERLAGIISVAGFDSAQPIKVVPKGKTGRYLIIKGHHQVCAMKMLGHDRIPGIVCDDLEELPALMSLVNDQSLEPTAHEKARHSWEVVSKNKATVDRYAKLAGLSPATVEMHVKAWTVLKHCTKKEDHSIPVTILAKVSALPQSDWKWMVGLISERGWTREQSAKAIKQVKRIKISGKYSKWLKEREWKEKAAIDAAEHSKASVVAELNRWIEEAGNALARIRAIKIRDTYSAPIAFAGTKMFEEMMWQHVSSGLSPSIADIQNAAASVLEHARMLDADKRIRTLVHGKIDFFEEEVKREMLLRLGRLEPVGLCMDVKDFGGKEESRQYDCVIADPPSSIWMPARTGVVAGEPLDLLPKEWVPQAAKAVKAEGHLVVLCNECSYLDIALAAREHGMELVQHMYWHETEVSRKDVPGMFVRSVSMIAVFCRQIKLFDLSFRRSWNGVESYREEYGDKASLLTGAGPKNDERLDWGSQQKPLWLCRRIVKAWCPEGGELLDLFSGTGSFALAAKQSLVHATCIEKSPEMVELAGQRIRREAISEEARRRLRGRLSLEVAERIGKSQNNS